jgi:hypothetical protein
MGVVQWCWSLGGSGGGGRGSLPNGIALLDQEIAARGREINTYSLNKVFKDIRDIYIIILSYVPCSLTVKFSIYWKGRFSVSIHLGKDIQLYTHDA